jgi:hypothetical protein
MGSNDSRSESQPLDPWTRERTYKMGRDNITKSKTVLGDTGYASPAFAKAGAYSAAEGADPGEARLMEGGDYDRLEESIAQSRLAPLRRFETLERERVDQDAANRGIWSSGLAMEAQGDLSERLAADYAAAGAEAATQRYGMQQQDNSMWNSWAQANADRAQQNTQFNSQGQNAWDQWDTQALRDYNQTQADKGYEAKWRPLDYLQGLWNQTGGTVSSSSGGGWSI